MEGVSIVFILAALVVGAIGTALLVKLFVINKMQLNEEELKAQTRLLESQVEDQRKLKDESNSSAVKLQAELGFAREQLVNKEQELRELNIKLAKDFENIANKVVNDSSKIMQQRHEDKLKDLLTPFRERIEQFEKKVDSSHEARIKESITLNEQIKQLKELNLTIGEEAKNLASALKGSKKMQGDWGEQQLERILQAAGLEKETHYKKQVDLLTADSQHQRPDYVVYLPDDKNLVIDSKVSLIAYERFYNADNEQASKPYALEHVKNVKDHIQRLSNVKYDQLLGINSPDYVIMYMPIEGALGLAMTEDPGLFEYALQRNIVLVSNNTLLATLKTVAFIWRQELQNKNALEIARQGGALYDKLVGFVDTLSGLGKKIDGARDDYDKAMNQLYDGKGNLVRRAEQLKELGIKTQKQLPERS